jgi:hypothetical protein
MRVIEMRKDIRADAKFEELENRKRLEEGR